MRGPRVLEATLRLRASLDAIAGALATPDIPRLIAAESELAHALSDIGSIRGVDRADRHALAAELIRARAALSRCRVLGSAASDVARTTLAVQGRSESYSRNGNATPPPPGGHDFQTRI